MAVYVIDSKNPLPPTHGEYETALEIASGDTVILAEGAQISAHGYGAWGLVGGTGTNLLIGGSVYSAWETAVAVHGTVTIGATGDVNGNDFGVQLLNDAVQGRGNVLNNAGSIVSETGFAVALNGPINVITNSGVIRGELGISGYLLNEAVASLTIYNTGIISASGTQAIGGEWFGPNTVINQGRIEGSVFFGRKNDLYDGRAGVLTGDIHLGAGDDAFYGGRGAERVYAGIGDEFIDGGDGEDTVLLHGSIGLTVDLSVSDKQRTTSTSWDTFRNIENLVADSGHDRLLGTSGNNALMGIGGDDILDGREGDDLLNGGTGDDTLLGGSGIDVARFNGSFADYSLAQGSGGSTTLVDRRSGPNDGTDTLSGIEYLQFADRTIALPLISNTAPVSIAIDSTLVDGDAPAGTVVGRLTGVDPDGDPLGYSLMSNPGGYFRIHGDKLLVSRTFTDRDADIVITVRASDPLGASIDQSFTIQVDPDVISVPPIPVAMAAEPPDLRLKGSKRADKLIGGDGDDYLNGKLGRDKLKGGQGDDAFAFTTKLGKSNLDRVLDFRSDDDTFVLSRKIFKGIGKGVLDKDAFRIGKKAADAEDRVIFNAKTGALFYDRDGSGSEFAAVKFAQVKAKTALLADDFLVI